MMNILYVSVPHVSPIRVPPHLVDAVKRQGLHRQTLADSTKAGDAETMRSYHTSQRCGACSSASSLTCHAQVSPDRVCNIEGKVCLQASTRLKAPDVPFGIGDNGNF